MTTEKSRVRLAMIALQEAVDALDTAIKDERWAEATKGWRHSR